MAQKRRRLAQRRRACGYSQERFAEAVKVDRTTVTRWESGETEPQPWHRRRLAKVLQVSIDELDELLAEGAGTGLPDEALDATVRVPSPPAASFPPWLAAASEHLRGSEVCSSAMQAFRAADRQVGGGHLYATVVSYLHREVAPRLVGGPESGDQGVFTAAAALTEMAGWMAHDAGRDKAAWQHFIRSFDLSQVGNDPQLMAHILASRSHLASHLDQPEYAIGLARRAQEVLSRGPRQPELEAQLLAMEARGLAARQNARDCIRQLNRAEHALTLRPAEPRSPWVSGFDEAALAIESARCFSDLGDLGAAGRHAERIVALRARDRPRSRAFGQLALVTVLVSQGRLEEACALTQEVLVATRHLSSYPVVQQLVDVRQRIAAQRTTSITAVFLGSLDVALRERRWLHPSLLGQQAHEQPPDAVGHA